MGYGKDLLADSRFEQDRGYDYSDRQNELDNLTNDELLEEAIDFGPDLNIDSFPAYDVAMKIKKYGWKMTPRQREAIINVMAHHHAFGE
jgi:hypothetical protein